MNPLHRILDANANRAREALRVMEDAARFGINSEPHSRALKELRHALRDALASLSFDHGVLLASRDTQADVGTAISTPAESDRDGLRGVVVAADARLTEALRSIEEASKALGEADAARRFEKLRYAAYTRGQQLILAMGSPARRQWRLCVLITESLCTHHSWESVALHAISGGADCLQLREKSLDSRDLLARARRLAELGRQLRIPVIINDRPDIAALAGASGVHLGQSDLSVRDARSIVGLGKLVGASTQNLDQARAAAAAGADYCGVGPMFTTQTKDKPMIAGPEYLREYLNDPLTTGLPHLAIGGVTPDNINDLAKAGCRGVAVSSSVCASKQPADICRRLVDALAINAIA